jgi:catechol 2,3-dioxygenase-like lactoylglutathione lyase family enzyme
MAPLVPFTRRQVLLSLPALAMAPKVWAQAAAGPPMAVRSISHFTLKVSDVPRSIDFYQGLFGLAIQARQGSNVLLKIGEGPQYLGLIPAAGSPPSISHFGLKVENFNADRVVQALLDNGVTKAAAGDPGLSGGPMKVRVTDRAGTPEIFVGDPDGLVVQLQSPLYCGGTGPLGAVCRDAVVSPKRGLLALREMSHATIGVTNNPRTVAFYQKLFGLKVQGHQGAAPFYGLGNGPQFLMFSGGAPAAPSALGIPDAPPPRPARIDHVCFSMTTFDPKVVTKALTDYGIKPRPTGGPAGPLQTYINLRMPERGGAPEGTPELYFTDPDGIAIQLQHTTYCGGSGFLGDTCNG